MPTTLDPPTGTGLATRCGRLAPPPCSRTCHPGCGLCSLRGSPTRNLIARFLLGYRDRTRAAYRADLRDFRAWCVRIRIGLLDVRRSHIEAYTRQLEQAGHSRASLARRLATLTGFYRYAVQEGTLPHSPVAHVRRPSMARDSQTLGLDREEAVRFLAAAEAASARDHALACLLTLNGLRVSEACAADVVDLDVERAHRVLAVIGKGGQRTLVPLAPQTVRAIDAALGGRTDGPLLVSNTGGRLDRHDAARIVARLARRAGLTKHITPHSMRHTMVTLALDAGVSLRDVQDAARHADPRTTRRTTVRAMPLTATPPIPWRRSSQKCSPPPPARTNPTRLPYIPG
jgi:integrase/recombinase XerD